MSDSIEGIKLVREAAKQIETLSPQVCEFYKHRRKKIYLLNRLSMLREF
jgi:hypothetical protein